MSVDKITQTIIDDANEKASEILQKAHLDADAVIVQSKQKAEKEAEWILQSARDRRKTTGQKMISAQKTEAKKDILQIKHDKIDEVFDKTYSAFVNMDNKTYAEFVEQLVLEHAETGQEELLMEKNYQQKLPATFLVTLNAKAALKGLKPLLKFSKEDAFAKGPGVILRHNNVYINCTVMQMLRDKRQQCQTMIYQILF